MLNFCKDRYVCIERKEDGEIIKEKIFLTIEEAVEYARVLLNRRYDEHIKKAAEITNDTIMIKKFALENGVILS